MLFTGILGKLLQKFKGLLLKTIYHCDVFRMNLVILNHPELETKHVIGSLVGVAVLTSLRELYLSLRRGISDTALLLTACEKNSSCCNPDDSEVVEADQSIFNDTKQIYCFYSILKSPLQTHLLPCNPTPPNP